MDLYVSGHIHFYERNTAIYKNASAPVEFESDNLIRNPGSTVYITSGVAGSDTGLNAIPGNGTEWSRVFSDDIGPGTIELLNSTTLLWTQYQAESKTSVDHLYLTKTVLRPF